VSLSSLKTRIMEAVASEQPWLISPDGKVLNALLKHLQETGNNREERREHSSHVFEAVLKLDREGLIEVLPHGYSSTRIYEIKARVSQAQPVPPKPEDTNTTESDTMTSSDVNWAPRTAAYRDLIMLTLLRHNGEVSDEAGRVRSRLRELMGITSTVNANKYLSDVCLLMERAGLIAREGYERRTTKIKLLMSFTVTERVQLERSVEENAHHFEYEESSLPQRLAATPPVAKTTELDPVEVGKFSLREAYRTLVLLDLFSQGDLADGENSGSVTQALLARVGFKPNYVPDSLTAVLAELEAKKLIRRNMTGGHCSFVGFIRGSLSDNELLRFKDQEPIARARVMLSLDIAKPEPLPKDVATAKPEPVAETATPTAVGVEADTRRLVALCERAFDIFKAQSDQATHQGTFRARDLLQDNGLTEGAAREAIYYLKALGLVAYLHPTAIGTHQFDEVWEVHFQRDFQQAELERLIKQGYRYFAPPPKRTAPKPSPVAAASTPVVATPKSTVPMSHTLDDVEQLCVRVFEFIKEASDPITSRGVFAQREMLDQCGVAPEDHDVVQFYLKALGLISHLYLKDPTQPDAPSVWRVNYNRKVNHEALASLFQQGHVPSLYRRIVSNDPKPQPVLVARSMSQADMKQIFDDCVKGFDYITNLPEHGQRNLRVFNFRSLFNDCNMSRKAGTAVKVYLKALGLVAPIYPVNPKDDGQAIVWEIDTQGTVRQQALADLIRLGCVPADPVETKPAVKSPKPAADAVSTSAPAAPPTPAASPAVAVKPGPPKQATVVSFTVSENDYVIRINRVLADNATQGTTNDLLKLARLITLLGRRLKARDEKFAELSQYVHKIEHLLAETRRERESYRSRSVTLEAENARLQTELETALNREVTEVLETYSDLMNENAEAAANPATEPSATPEP